jgi:serine phosphatase RsbU (regulator of sigma subunit)
MFGKQRFMEIIRENSERSVQQILDQVYDELERFTIDMKPADDITLVVIKVVN